MTDDRIWEQASIGERVEMLRGRVERVEQREKILGAKKWSDPDILGHFHGDHARPKFACVSGFTPGSEGERHEYVACAELARLRRIEEAARVVVKHLEGMFDPHSDEGCCEHVRMRLAEALDSEPKR